ncbi:hypothetical protein [Nibricoccus sp. IMCC34717]|uniref:hypothetical protein n=1 Tax=Nibricoccus sp. IMCC34717 TaxID=3034021 RepID=UPI00384E34A8
MRKPSLLLTALLVFAALYAGVSAWVSAQPLLSRSDSGLYQSLTDGFLSGQLSLTTKPDPRLAQLENPWAGYQGIPRLHDATYFNGKYYLYFGVTPVLLVFAPVRVLTGLHVSNACATGVFAFAAFAAYSMLWRRLCQSRECANSAPQEVMGYGIIGCGTFLTLLLGSDTFYAVPIAAAQACGAFSLLFLTLAFSSQDEGKALRSLAWASACSGLAVAARPTWAFSCLLLSLPFVGVICTAHAKRTSFPLWRWLAAGFGPVGISALGLAWYNYARFGNPFEFGVRYQFTSIDQRNLRLWDITELLPHLREYLTAIPDWTRYFPWVRLDGDALSLTAWAPLAGVGLVATLVFSIRILMRRTSPVAITAGLVGLSGIFNYIVILGYAFLVDRYALDFLPQFVFAGLALAVLQRDSVKGRSKWVLAGLFTLTVGVTLSHSIALSLRQWSVRERLPHIARIANQPVAWLESLTDARMGPVEIQIEFSAGKTGRSEPILSSSRGRDVLFVRYIDDANAELGFAHAGYPTIFGERFPIRAGERQVIRADLGFLYPDEFHPKLAAWPSKDIERAKRGLRVWVDGKAVIDRDMLFHAADLGDVEIGRTHSTAGIEERFTGKLMEMFSAGIPSDPKTGQRNLLPGWLKFELVLPRQKYDISEPLLALGREPFGNLFYIRYTPDGRIRFGHSSKQYGLVESTPLDYTPDVPTVIEVGIEAVEKELPAKLTQSRIVIRKDGKTAMAMLGQIWPFDASSVALGMNSVQFNHCGPLFTGSRFVVSTVTPQWEETKPQTGRYVLQTRLNPALIGRAEPILTRGSPGAANCIAIVYVDDRHVRFVHDNWGYGATQSDLVPVLYDVPVSLELTGGMLVPDDGLVALPEKWRKKLRIAIDGKVVWETDSLFHPATAALIEPLANSVGISSASTAFTSEVISAGPVAFPVEGGD